MHDKILEALLAARRCLAERKARFPEEVLATVNQIDKAIACARASGGSTHLARVKVRDWLTSAPHMRGRVWSKAPDDVIAAFDALASENEQIRKEAGLIVKALQNRVRVLTEALERYERVLRAMRTFADLWTSGEQGAETYDVLARRIVRHADEALSAVPPSPAASPSELQATTDSCFSPSPAAEETTA